MATEGFGAEAWPVNTRSTRDATVLDHLLVRNTDAVCTWAEGVDVFVRVRLIRILEPAVRPA